jgi:hypothetical protein
MPRCIFSKKLDIACTSNPAASSAWKPMRSASRS